MKLLYLSLILLLTISPVWSATQVSPNDPTQYIRYWSDQIIEPLDHEDAAWAHRVYEQLLRAWDYSRVAPNLNVIDVEQGTWAASLADGNILMTRSTLQFVRASQPEYADDLLAFVLAHELAHQRSDDLWHLKFYRMVGDQSPEQKSQVLGNLVTTNLNEIEKAEAQADQDAVVLMASVGYNPHRILDVSGGKDFYTTWVEQLWQNGCVQSQHTQLKIACAQAQLRALRTKAQLESITQQTVLYELGVQALVANDVALARRYFTVFGRSFPNRAVLTSIGLTYLVEAIELDRSSRHRAGERAIYFPVFIDAQPRSVDAFTAKRGVNTHKEVRSLAEKSLEYFAQAKKLAPDYRGTYLLMISAYQLMNNTAMATGLLQGEYISRFGDDLGSQYLSAINLLTDGQTVDAQLKLNALNFSNPKNGLPVDELRYAALMNRTAIALENGDEAAAKALWLSYAQTEQQSQIDLFHVALNQLQPERAIRKNIKIPYVLSSLRIGDKWLKGRPTESTEIWYDGSPYQLYTLDGRAVILDDDQRIVSVWLNGNTSAQLGELEVNWPVSRVIGKHGVPSRRVDLVTGQYLAFDAIGLAVRVQEQRVRSWFYYLPQ